MEPVSLDSLPNELHPYYSQLQSATLPCIEFQAIPCKTKLIQSKILGLPYLPIDHPYPHDANGQPMMLLAQLNFAEIPSLLDYPEHGILQFFISAADDLYGADLDSFEGMQQQRNFCVRYFDRILPQPELVQDFEFLRPEFQNQDLNFPAEWECRLDFSAGQSWPSPEDYRFNHLFGATFFDQFGESAPQIKEAYWQLCSAQGHRIGGYAFFTQQDPRYQAPKDEDWVLLLQIDSDDQAGILWGDVGVGSFFIPRQNLLNCDFSRILYHWDCA